ncbi:MAG: ATP-binding cassette domain-containing protein [Phycisphaerales bacterium]|nr:ATP-binding cassette domain-containing protein [Phycisphaerales bacterium]
MAALKINNLAKTYPQRGCADVHALRPMSLELEDGQVLAVTGESGCGKTTLLMVLGGLVVPTTGTITLGGRVLDGVRPDQRDIAMVFQHDALYPHLSARKHLELSLRGGGVMRSEVGGRIGSVAEALGIEGCLGRKPGALSGGQRRRVALARAMVRTPGLLLLDEPFAGVDPDRRSSICKVLKDLWKKQRTTVLLMTHSASAAADLGDSVVSMDTLYKNEHSEI